jgi:outer membrane biosynthesis protein TonB
VPKNEDGEFELILANRQLLSVFFIVVILLGVFFTMGYIVGRNSAPLVSDASSASKPDAKPPVSEAPARPIDSAPAETPAPAKEPVTAAAQPPVATEPQKAEPEPPKPEPEPIKQPAATKARKEPKAAAASRVVAGQTYLQLAATSRHEAEIMVDVLRKKGFKAMDAEIEEKPGTFRVLVGPVADSGSTNKMRADLEGAGFPGNIAIRRTF